MKFASNLTIAVTSGLSIKLHTLAENLRGLICQFDISSCARLKFLSKDLKETVNVLILVFSGI